MRRGVVYDAMGAESPDHCPPAWSYPITFPLNLHYTSPVPRPSGESPGLIESEGGVSTGVDGSVEALDSSKQAGSATNSAITTTSSTGEAHGAGVGSEEASVPEAPLILASTATVITTSIPLYRTPDEVGDICVSNLLRVFGENTMRIFNAILSGQRVLFVGYNHAAKDVAQMVLSAVAMVAPPLTNVIRRVYAYANLTDLTFLQVWPVYLSLYLTLTFLCLHSLLLS